MENNPTKTIVFDMDGTIADLYNVENWKQYLDDEDTYPYREAKPCVDIVGLRAFLDSMKKCGCQLQVVSWTSMGGSITYNEEVRKAKIEWLQKHDLLKYFDHVHIVKYGTPKLPTARNRAKRTDEWYLYDDNFLIRHNWTTAKKCKKRPNTYSYDEQSLKLICDTFKGCTEIISEVVSNAISATLASMP